MYESYWKRDEERLRMAQADVLETLLDELTHADDTERHARLLAHCEDLGEEGAGPVLRDLLSSPDKWQRDLAADVANTMGFDPFVDEDEPELPEEEQPVLTLGFEDTADSIAPPASVDHAPPSGRVVTIDDDDEDDPEAVQFLGPCIDPEAGSSPTIEVTEPVRRVPPMLWVAAGLAFASGLVVYLWLSPSGGGFLR
jgi:hypothetical protein